MSSEIILKKWIAIYTKPRHEKTVKSELNKKGFEVYLPMLKERQKWSDRKKWVEFPLFRSYLFVKVEIKNAIFILQTTGVVKVIKFGKEIAIIKDENIKSIKLMIDGGFKPESIDYFIKGDPVTVIEGPLKGLSGEVIRLENDDFLVLRINTIQHSISVKINKGFLKIG